MSHESVEAQLARMDERWKRVELELEHSSSARKAQYEATEKLSQQVTKMDGRMTNVEASLATAQPTIQEFITIKHKVVGAGAMGKWLWIAVAALLGLITSYREAIFNYFSKAN